MIAITLYLTDSTNRVGSVTDSGDPSKRPLRWDDFTLVVKQAAPESDADNELSIEFSTPNGKTANSRDLPVALPQDPNPLLCPVLRHLVRGQHAGALEDLPLSVPELLTPLAFASTQSPTLRFPLRGAGAVYTRPSSPLTPEKVATFFAATSAVLGFSAPIRPHALRSSIASTMKALGEYRALFLL